jgi:hypothetical protein
MGNFVKGNVWIDCAKQYKRMTILFYICKKNNTTNNLFSILYMDNKVTLYNKKIKDFLETTDKEDKHIIRDEILMNFIQDIAMDNLMMEEIMKISKRINNKIVKSRTEFWYA